jgi:cytochrome c biogenesis protein CcmG/thiol:disulfide interchange protein DsbE
VYGVPETFVVDGSGCIQYKHISVMTRDVLEEEILPRMRGQKHVPCEK